MDRGREWRGVSRRKFLRTAAASGIALTLTRLALAEEPGFPARETLPGRKRGTRPRREPDASTASPRLPEPSSTRPIFAPPTCRAGRRRLRTRSCSGPPTRPMSTPVSILSPLSGALKPAAIVTADDLVRTGARVPAFYAGDLFCPVGKTPIYLGQPVALLIFEDFDAFDQARLALRDARVREVRRGNRPGRDAQLRRVSIYPARPARRRRRADVYSPVKNGWVSPGKFQKAQYTEIPIWPPLPIPRRAGLRRSGDYGEKIRAELASDNPALLVLDREFETQSVDPMFLEPESGLALVRRRAARSSSSCSACSRPTRPRSRSRSCSARPMRSSSRRTST